MTPLKCHPSISDVDVDAKADSEAVAEVVLRTGAAAAFWPLCVGIAVLDLGYER